MNAENFYTITDIMRILQVSRVTVYRYINSGSLRAYRLGGSGDWRIPKEAIDEFMEIAHQPVERDGYA